MLEKEIEKKLVEGVHKIGGRAYKFVSPGNDGVPDRMVLLPGGSLMFAELKTEKGKLSSRQKVQIRTLQALGFDVRVLYGLSDVEDFLREVTHQVENFQRLAGRIR